MNSVIKAIGIFNELSIHFDDHIGVAVAMTLAIHKGFSPQLKALVAKLCRVCFISRYFKPVFFKAEFQTLCLRWLLSRRFLVVEQKKYSPLNR
jgi:hypothetical protein